MDDKNREVENIKGVSERANEINCALCNLTLKKNELKFLLSSIELLELDLPLEKRQLCIDCYSKINDDVPRIKKYKQKLNLYKETNFK